MIDGGGDEDVVLVPGDGGERVSLSRARYSGGL